MTFEVVKLGRTCLREGYRSEPYYVTSMMEEFLALTSSKIVNLEAY